MIVESKSHPKHYLMHKYWGRKSHTFISEYIKIHTKKNEIVLDPFMGSGVVIIESNKLSRKAIGIDLNPISVFIVANTLSNVDSEIVLSDYEKILHNIPQDIYDLAITNCPTCNEKSKFVNAIWDNGKLARIKGYCENHKAFSKNADKSDIVLYEKSIDMLESYAAKGYFYPTNKILDYVKRSGVTTIDKLFSSRNLLICAFIYSEIKKISNKKSRDTLLMAFTSMLPNVSSMIPGDSENIQGKSGWQISKFWVPKIHTEKNVFDSFDLRLTKVIQGKKEITPLLTDTKFDLYTKNSEKISFIKSDSIDYIFTDPPYGESIAYFGLSMFWNSWLDKEVDYESEIIYDPYRKKGYDDYRIRLTNAYKEMYRVLKPGKFLSFTFHNRSLKFWKIIIDACLETGFELDSIAWQPQAVNSGTQGINRKNTLYGDFVYNFIKPKNNILKIQDNHPDPEELILGTFKSLFSKHDFIETSKIFEVTIPLIVKNRAFEDKDGKTIDVDKILRDNYSPEEITVKGKLRYGWKK